VPFAATGVGLVAGGALPAQAAAPIQRARWTTLHLELDITPVNPVSVVRAGSGPPQCGDSFYVEGPIFATGDAGGARIGKYQCFGPWTADSNDSGAPDNRLTTVEVTLDGRVAIMGLINETTMGSQAGIVGAVHGGTGEFLAALGSFHQPRMMVPGADGGTVAVLRGIFDLVLLNLSSY